MYEKFLRPDITFKILSNYPFYLADIEEDFEKFKNRLSEYDVGVWVDEEWRIENGELRKRAEWARHTQSVCTGEEWKVKSEM